LFLSKNKRRKELDSMREVAIAGMGFVKFGRYDGQKGRPYKEIYELGAEAITKALKYADMEWKDIQAAYGASMFGGLGVPNQCTSRLGMPGFPITTVEGACSSSQQAMRQAYFDIANGLYDVGLAFGTEKIPPGLIADTLSPVWMLRMGFNLPGTYALGTRAYMQASGATEEDMARVAVMERKNAIMNPNAFWYQGPEITVEEVLNSRVIASPIRFLMACANADGAAAAIICSKDKLKSKARAVTIVGSAHATATYGYDNLGNSVREKMNPNCTELACKQVWEMSGYGPEDMDVIQLYEAMSPGFLWDAEDCGFCKPGEAGKLVREGYFEIGGKMPANTDGGLMGRGHPTGATGIAQIAELFFQLREEAGPRQVPGAKIAFNHCSGGGPNALCHVLKR
jgi:benzoylsuccinyl-CoA thiolase BbsB subunit